MIIVTGAGGVVGTALVRQLESERVPLRLAYHSREKVEHARRAGKDAVAVDFADRATLGPALEGVDSVFLLGAGGPNQVDHELNLIEASKVAGVRKIVKLSVWGADAGGFAIARLHGEIERALQRSDLPFTLLRPNGFMQNFVTHMAGSIRAQGAFYLPGGDAKISHVDVRDIAKVAARALTSREHDGKAYELSGPEALTYGEAADVLSRVLGKTVRYVPVSDEDARNSMISGGMPAFYADYLVDLNRFYRTGAGAAVRTTVRDVTGSEPTGFEQFVRDHQAAFQ